jgi:hypothetical protein
MMHSVLLLQSIGLTITAPTSTRTNMTSRFPSERRSLIPSTAYEP